MVIVVNSSPMLTEALEPNTGRHVAALSLAAFAAPVVI